MARNFRPSLTVLRQLNTPVPDITLDLVAQNGSATSVDLVWSEPNLNGTTFEKYEVQFRECGTSVWATHSFVPVTSPTNNYTVTGLNSETCYEFRVSTISTDGPSPFGNVDDEETTPNIPLFNTDFAYFAVANVTSVYIVSLDNGNVITQNGTALPTLNAGDTTVIPASQFDEFIGTGAFNVVGLISNDWYPLNPNYTVGKTFAYGAIRNNPQTVSLYAFQDSNITITAGGTIEHSAFIPANTGQNFAFNSTNENIIIQSDGLVMSSKSSNGNVDQGVLLPASRELVGFPSSRARVYPTEQETYRGAYRASGVPYGGGGHWDTTEDGATSGNTGNQYAGDSVTVQSNKPVTAQSFADADGGKAAAFLPTTLMRTRFGVPFVVERVAFASTDPFTITSSNGNTYNSVGVGNANRIRVTAAADRVAGTLFNADVPVAAWTEPDLNDQDEIVLFGF